MIFGHVVSISQAYSHLLRASYSALIGAILSFSRAFWLTVFGFMYTNMVVDSCVNVRCMVLRIDKCLGRRCRSVVNIVVSFLLASHLLVGGNSYFLFKPYYNPGEKLLCVIRNPKPSNDLFSKI
jgi:hypothetical protein